MHRKQFRSLANLLFAYFPLKHVFKVRETCLTDPMVLIKCAVTYITFIVELFKTESAVVVVPSLSTRIQSMY